MAIPIISFIGRSSSGKTTLLTGVVGELKRRGIRLAVVKHTHHDFEFDQPGKDTWRLSQAGSDVVVISSPQRMALIQQVGAERTLAEILALVEGEADIVITEGYKNSGTEKVLVLSGRPDESPPYFEGELVAVVPARMSSSGEPEFDDDDVADVVELLVARVKRNPDNHHRGRSVSEVDWLEQRPVDGFEDLLAKSAAVHGHICPGQVLGVRMAILGTRELGICCPDTDKRLIVYVEIDRCATDAIQAVTGCRPGKRTLKYVDYGKLAATFVDLRNGNAVRVAAREDARDRVSLYSPGQQGYEAQIVAYKVMPDEELFRVERVMVPIPPEDMPGPPLRRVICSRCGEGINDYRDVERGGQLLCRPCAHGSYYQTGIRQNERCLSPQPRQPDILGIGTGR